jgi:hypothetical protein
MASSAELIHAEVGSWPGVTLSPHRFGGVEFNLGRAEIGHLHGSRLLDVPFTRRLRGALIAGQHAEPHHVLGDSGWVSFWLRSEADVPHAIWLLRLSYVRHVMVNHRKPRGGEPAVAGLDIGALVEALHLSDMLRSALLARAV